MKDIFKAIALFLVGLFGTFALGWIVQGNNFFMFKFFAPKTEQVRREVFEQSKAYRQGMVQELQNMQFEYIKADKSGKDAMRSIILHRAADVPPDALPMDLNAFISGLKSESNQKF